MAWTGMLHSPEIKNSTAISRHYICLSQACLTIDSPFGNITIACIDTLLLHTNYIHKLEDPQSPPKAWATLGVAMKLAQMVGILILHNHESGLPSPDWIAVCYNVYA